MAALYLSINYAALSRKSTRTTSGKAPHAAYVTKSCENRGEPSVKSAKQPEAAFSRRAALKEAAMLTLAAPLLTLVPAQRAFAKGSARNALDYAEVANDITALMAADADKGPTLVRLAWHSSGTYDKMTKTGGSGQGTIRFQEELAHGGNAGLVNAVGWMEPIHQKYAAAGLSYADLYTLGGVVAIKNMGGPAIPFQAGRVDAMDPSAVTPDGRLPNADVGEKGADKSDGDHLRDVFYRMGFDDQEIVALSGAHALGRCHAEYSGYVGPWTGSPTTFTNAYFQLLLKAQYVYDDRYPNYQYKDASGTLMMLPSDIILVKDEGFLPYVVKYSKNKKAFNDDFAAAFQKLEELGTSGLSPVSYA